MFKYEAFVFSMETGAIVRVLGSYSSQSEALASVKTAAGIKRLDSVPIELVEGGLQIYPGGTDVITILKRAVMAA